VAVGTANHARRAAPLFDPGDHHGADDAHGLRSGIAANRRAHRPRRRSARPRSRGAGSLDIEPPEQDAGSAARRRLGAGPLHLLVDSAGLKLGGAGDWLVKKHGTSRRRGWRHRVCAPHPCKTVSTTRRRSDLPKTRSNGSGCEPEEPLCRSLITIYIALIKRRYCRHSCFLHRGYIFSL
jgi:hypothetical protein